MSVHWPVAIIGHPALRQPTREYSVYDLGVARRLADQLAELMDIALEETGLQAVGFAANQIAMLRRLCIVHPPDARRTVLVNPRIVDHDDATEDGPEQCFSIPGWTHHVRRPTAVTVEALDLDGNTLTFDAEGFEARIVCHEIDHLDGRLIVDHGPRQARRAFGRWLTDQHLLTATGVR